MVDDFDAIDSVVSDAFGQKAEADLVRALRKTEGYKPEYSLVAVLDGEVIGHIMLSEAMIVSEGEKQKVLCLAPLSVRSNSQKMGVGSALAKEAIKKARQDGWGVITVEGNPKYYSRFGFIPGYQGHVTFNLPAWAPKESGMILSLKETSIEGSVVYPEVFQLVGS